MQELRHFYEDSQGGHIMILSSERDGKLTSTYIDSGTAQCVMFARTVKTVNVEKESRCVVLWRLTQKCFMFHEEHVHFMGYKFYVHTYKVSDMETLFTVRDLNIQLF